MKKNILIFALWSVLSFSCIHTPANLKNEEGQYVARNGKVIVHLDKQATELFYPSLKYLANDLGAQITYSSKTKLAMQGKLDKGYEVSIEFEQKLESVCEVRVYSSRHKKPNDILSNQVISELLPLIQ